MKATKQKAVINAEASQLGRVQRLIESGRYPTVSAFVREAIEEKLGRIEQDRVAEAVERYCAAGHADEDLDLIAAQTVEPTRRSPTSPRPVVLRGEVWWGQPALPGGSRKRRPFLIVSHNAFNRNERYPKVMVVHLTSVRRAGDDYPWEVELPRGAGGLPVSSVAKCGEIYTLLKAHFTALAGALRTEQMDQVDRALATALALRAK